jgi:16S rRNA (guanine527-N7)-methyltransferase
VLRSDERQPIALPNPPALEVPADFGVRLDQLGIRVDAGAIGKIGDFLARLLAMNERMNLTAIESPDAAWQKHAFDALTLVPLLQNVPAAGRIADIGSGGGLPGIPLAIARPDLRVTLIESIQKKSAFLSAVATALLLSNVNVLAERAEKLTSGSLRNAFDVVTARAVARLSDLLPLTAPFAKPGGRLLLIKGQKAPEELAEAQRILVKMRCRHVETVVTPTGRIVVIEKMGKETA